METENATLVVAWFEKTFKNSKYLVGNWNTNIKCYYTNYKNYERIVLILNRSWYCYTGLILHHSHKRFLWLPSSLITSTFRPLNFCIRRSRDSGMQRPRVRRLLSEICAFLRQEKYVRSRRGHCAHAPYSWRHCGVTEVVNGAITMQSHKGGLRH